MKRNLKVSLFQIRDSLPGYFGKKKQQDIAEVIASRGDLELLRYAREKQKYSFDHRVVEQAILLGSFSMLDYVFQEGCIDDLNFYRSMIVSMAVKHNRLDIVKYLEEKKCPINQYYHLDQAAYYGYLPIIQYILEKENYPFQCSKYVFRSAVESGNIEIVRYLFHKQIPWDSEVTAMAVQLKNWNILRFLIESGCPLESNAYIQAVDHHDIEMIYYLYEQGCPWTEGVCSMAATKGYLDILRYAHEHGCPWTEDVSYRAVLNSEYACLDYVYDQQGPIRDNILYYARDIKMVHYLLLHGAHPGPSLCFYSLHFGDLSKLRWVHEQGYAFHPHCYQIAIKRNQFDIVVYLHEQGYPWNEQVFSEAVKNRYLNMVVYLHTHGCPWDEDTYRQALWSYDESIFDYLYDHDCPRINGYEIACQTKNTRLLYKLTHKKEPFPPFLLTHILFHNLEYMVPFFLSHSIEYTKENIHLTSSRMINLKQKGLPHLYHLSQYVSLTSKQQKHVQRYLRRFDFLFTYLITDIAYMIIAYL